MEYFELNHIRVKIKYKELVDEILSEIYNVVDKIMFVKARPNQDGHAEIWIDERSSECRACVDIPKIKKLEDLYLFCHESGHVVHKHLTDFETKINIEQKEIINREREADTYALEKMEKWLATLSPKHREREKLENIVEIIKSRINSGYEEYVGSCKEAKQRWGHNTIDFKTN